MRELKVDIPEISCVGLLPVYFHSFVVASAPSRCRVSGRSFNGERFRSGGGFDGGGAGVR